MSLNNKAWLLPLLCLVILQAAFAQEDFVYEGKLRRNPFIPLVSPEGRLIQLDKEEPAPGALTIEGLIYDENGRSYAIVNASVVGVGDAVDDYRVLKIEEDKVIFIKEGQILEVAFDGGEEK